MTIIARLNAVEWIWRGLYGFDFFISYAHEDGQEYAHMLHKDLTSAGFRCFLDSSELQAGERLTGSLTRTLRRSQVLLVLHSPAADRSDWVAQEVTLFEQTRRRIIAVDLQGPALDDGGTNLSALQRALKDRIYIPESDPSEPSEETLRQVRRSFAGVRTQSRRIGILSVAVGILLVIASMATILAFIAEDRRKIAVSRQLAVASVAAAEERQDLSLLLAALAFESADTFEARNSLLHAIMFRPRLISFLRHQSTIIQSGSRGGSDVEVTQVGFAGDSQQVWARESDNTIFNWNIDARAVPETRTQFQQETHVRRALLNPAGTLAAQSLEDGVVLLDLLSGTVQQRLPHGFGTGKLTFSAQGSTLAFGSEDGVILVWDITRPNPIPLQLTQSNASPPRPGAISVVHPIVLLKLSPDGGKLLSLDSKHSNPHLWDLTQIRAGNALDPILLQHETARVSNAVLHPDNRTITAIMSTGALRQFRTKNGKPISTEFARSRSEMRSPTKMALRPDGRWLATGSRDGTIALWDLGFRQPTPRTISGHRGAVTNLAFNLDGSQLITGSKDGSVMLWDTSRLDSNIQPNVDSVTSMSRVLGTKFTDGVVFSPDGSRVAAVSDGAVTLWSEDTSEKLTRFEHDRVSINSLAISPDGKTLATGGTRENLIFWDIERGAQLGKPVRTNPRRGNRVSRLAYSPDGNSLVAGTSGGGLFIFDTASRKQQGRPFRKASPDPREITQLAFSPNGERLAVGSAHIDLLWDFIDRTPLDPPLQENASRAVAVSRNGQMVAASSVDGIVLWDLDTRKRIGELAISSVELLFEDDKTTSLAFNDGGTILAVGREDGRIQLWDIATRRPLGPPLRRGRGSRSSRWPSGTPSLAFQPGGTVLAAGGDDGLSLWDVDPANWVLTAQRMANRSLSDDELDRYLGGL